MKRNLQKFKIEDIWKLSSNIRNESPTSPLSVVLLSQDDTEHSEVSLFTDSINKTLEVLE